MASIADLSKYRDPDDQVHAYELALTDREDTRLLVVDQTLGNCALSTLCLHKGRLSVDYAKTLRPVTDLKGNAGNLERAEQLQEMLILELDGIVGGIDRVVYETPPAANRMQRPESSLLAAHCLRWAVKVNSPSGRIIVESIGAQRAKAHVCGNSRASKGEAHAEMVIRYSDLIEGYKEHITNEHLRDALMLGLTYLEA